MAKWTLSVPRGFTALMQRLGCAVPMGANVGMDLTGNIVPVAIVDSDITLSSVSVPPEMGTPVSAGELAAPLANAVMADSGALTSGTYVATILLGSANEAGDIGIRIVRRNAADAADIWSALVFGRQSQSFIQLRVVVGTGEFIRVRVGPQNAGAGSVWQATMWLSS